MVMSNNTMVFDFGRDHAKFIGLGGGSTRGSSVTAASGRTSPGSWTVVACRGGPSGRRW